MKRIAIELGNLGYDMTTTTLRDVIRPAKGETEAQRMRRLAAKAIIEGCQAFYLAGDMGRCAVSSGTYENTAYLVDIYAGTCTCEGWEAGHRPCKHIALVLAELGELPHDVAVAA